MKFLLEVITPERQVFSQEIEAVSVPTAAGFIEVLAHHTPLFASITEGEIKIVSGTKEFYLAIGGGFMEVTKHGCIVLVSRAFHADELNEGQIREAHRAAQQAIEKGAKGEELASAQAVLRRSLLELKVLRRRKLRGPSPLPV